MAVIYTMILGVFSSIKTHRIRALYLKFLIETSTHYGTIMLLLGGVGTLSPFAMAFTGIPSAISALDSRVSNEPIMVC